MTDSDKGGGHLPKLGPKTKVAGGSAGIIATLTLAITFAEDIKGLLSDVPVVGTNAQVERLEQKHIADMEALMPIVQKSMTYGRKSYENTLPPRILNLLRAKCRTPQSFTNDPTRQLLLDDLLVEYKELRNRTYNVGTCNSEGQYCDAMGICHD